jgi:hypothetical protein
MGPTPGPSQASAQRGMGVTAGAFDFTFATPSKPSLKGKDKEKQRDVRPVGTVSGFGLEAFQTPRKEGNKREAGTAKKEGTPLRKVNPIAPMSDHRASVHSLPAALGKSIHVAKEEAGDPGTFKTPKKLTSLSSVHTPWTVPARLEPARPRTPDSGSLASKKRRLGDLEVHLPSTKGTDEKEDLGRRVALRQMGEGVKLEGVGTADADGKEDEREVGVGISPRKGKVKWTGRG